ncbi:P-loop NTPase fold protein [Zobellia sp. 1_MG-2023]|uniref:P-loop NTPase fold protein n=1 Tax=Zobellia sp. 1_MG-2023 TaxID=3062626 RepID=UPI0026E1A11B|nr:P-loop NTPase fold protein [Zobellia sp. 1_MG-2023]MDO6818632.1 P-loop NTPase fold protein [Zobellia sp. 1_MG-2023]
MRNNRLEKVVMPFEDFEIKFSQNSKILFSGVFGSGKTTFIKDFFEKNDTYQSIHIYPVNYSVASNEDIFELIKFDILLQLIGKIPKEDFEKIEIPYHLTLWTYLISKENLGGKIDFFASFLSFSAKYGGSLLKVYDQLKILKNKYELFHRKFQEDDLKTVTDYLGRKSTEIGNIYEEDFFTELIRTLIEQLKGSKSEGSLEKPMVLVIDDLDRLDPDHIFRLLNIFSAHIDFMGVENDNKFDFDKVILVCDYNNVKNVFIHRYGLQADFCGYIDKFYSAIYWFSSSSFINKIIGKYLNDIDVGVGYDFFTPDYRVGGHIRYVIEELIKYNLLNFRELLRCNESYDLRSGKSSLTKYPFAHKTIFYQFDFNVVTIIHFLLDFFDNTSAFLNKIEKAKFIERSKGYENNDEDGRHKIVELLVLINYMSFAPDKFNKNTETNIELEYDNYVFICRPLIRNYVIAFECVEILKDGEESDTKEISYFAILEEAVKTYIDLIK